MLYLTFLTSFTFIVGTLFSIFLNKCVTFKEFIRVTSHQRFRTQLANLANPLA